jgi:hypothetical protein
VWIRLEGPSVPAWKRLFAFDRGNETIKPPWGH